MGTDSNSELLVNSINPWYDIVTSLQGGDFMETKDIIFELRTKKLRFKLYIKTFKRAVLCSPFLRKIIMKSGFTAIEPYKKP